MKRPYGTGQIYVKSGACYGRWRTAERRRRNKRLGPVRLPGSSEGLTRAMAEQALRKVLDAEPTAAVAEDARGNTVDDAADALRERLELQGARKSYRQNCESMQRVHIADEPRELARLTQIGKLERDSGDRGDGNNDPEPGPFRGSRVRLASHAVVLAKLR